MPQFDIELPDSRVLTVEADDEAAALRGAQQWHAANPIKAPPPGGAELRNAPEPSIAERITNWAMDTLSGGQKPSPEVRRLAEGLPAALGLIAPPLGFALSGDQAIEESHRNNLLGAALNAIGVLGPPGVGPTAARAGRAATPGAAELLQDRRAALDPAATAVRGGLPDAARMEPEIAHGLPAREQIIEAGERLNARANAPGAAPGIDQTLTVPRGVTGPNSLASVPALVADTPVAGQPLKEAATNTINRIGAAKDRIVADFSPAIAAQPDAAGAVHEAGTTAGEALREWMRSGGTGARILNRVYDSVERLLPANATHTLANTTAAVNRLQMQMAESATRSNQPAIDLVWDGVTRAGGLNFRGLRQLRTEVIQRINDTVAPAPATAIPALKQLRTALTQDLNDLVAQQGGPAAQAAFQRANHIADLVRTRRDNLKRIIGVKADASPAQIIDRIIGNASSTNRANVNRLIAARRAAGPEAWDEVAAAALERMGLDKNGATSPARLTTALGRWSDTGRQLVFGGRIGGQAGLNDAITDLVTLSRKFEQLDRLRNTSGTAKMLSVHGAIAAIAGVATGAWNGFMTAVGTAAGTYGLARLMARPAVAKSIARFGNAAYEMQAHPDRRTAAMAALAANQMSLAIGRETGEDPEAVHARLMGALGHGTP